MRITDWVPGKDGAWYQADQRYLEAQWLVGSEGVERDWTLFVHFTRPDGTKIAQADHLLGKLPRGPVLTTTQWPTEERIYDYVLLPEALQDAEESFEIRLGVWDPISGDHLDVEPVNADKDEAGRLIISLEDM